LLEVNQFIYIENEQVRQSTSERRSVESTNDGYNLKMRELVIFFAGLIGIVVYLSEIYFVSNTDGAAYNQCNVEPGMIKIIGGEFTMGAGGVYPEEGPAQQRRVEDFLISRHEITNKEFAEFVDATEYVTTAERKPDPALYPNIPEELLKPGSAIFVKLDEAVQAATLLNWWHFREGAYWRAPTGSGSNITDKEYYPVIHIALEDARAYAKWKGHRLPTEAEYEYASRGGIEGAKYATGDSLKVNGKFQANTWQGFFPFNNSVEDGHDGIAPVGCYESNGYGVHDMIGNVWEWTQTAYYPAHNPNPASQFNSTNDQYGYDSQQSGVPVGVIKGGSYLCANDFCARYRPAARHAQDTGLGTSHIGFRTVKDV
jgi:formylglycine-generating enzyme required for sulfatase activity